MRMPQRANAQRARISKVDFLPPPVSGWDAVSALAKMPVDRAVVLDNWFPTPSDVRVRAGHEVFASGMGSAEAVETLMVYEAQSAVNDKMFAVAAEKFWDVSTEGTATVTTVTGLANNRWQYVNYTVAGGHYLWCCNGADNPRHWNGSAWASPSLSVVTASDIINVNVHKNRLWLIVNGSMSAYYLATGAIAGAATAFLLGGVMDKGGYLMAMATWTLDGGSGTDDFAVFMSSEGQVAVYQGTDPASANTWSLVGVYNLGKPLGRRCFTKVAGDIALINEDGVLPLSKALGQDRGAAPAIAITQRINNAMNSAARSYGTRFGWELTAYPRGTMAILNVPIVENSEAHQYVMNTLTGAWARFTGQDANTWVVFGNNLYFGSNTGCVMKADTGCQDNGEAIDAIGQAAYNYYSYRGLKEWVSLQTLLTTSSEVSLAVGMSTDFRDNANLGTPVATASGAAEFDSATWDLSTFAVDFISTTAWTSVTGLGMCGSINFRAITGQTGLSLWGSALWGSGVWNSATEGDIILRLNGFHVLYQPGEVL